MPSTRQPQLCLILMFLALIGSVPLLQAALELAAGARPQALEVFRQKPTAPNLRRYEHDLTEASRVAGWLRPWAQYVLFAGLGDGGGKTLVGRAGWLFYKPGVQGLTDRPAHGSHTVEEAAAAIVDFRDQLQARGLRLLIVPAPNKESIYPEYVTRRAAGLGAVPGAGTRALLQQLAAAGVEVADLFALFAAGKTNATAPLYLAQDSHWSPAGVELAAQLVARRITGRGWLQTGTTAYLCRPAPIERVGDLLDMLQLPRTLTRETVPCRQVVRADDGAPYRDEPGAEVLVLGDSFLRIYATDEPGAAGFSAHLARELKQPVLSLINDGGGATLVRQELCRRPQLLAGKKVVIWEFVERDLRLATEGWPRVSLPPPAHP